MGPWMLATTATMNGVPVRSTPAVRVLQRAPQDIHFPRDRDEMDMVGHQTVAHDCQAVQLNALSWNSGNGPITDPIAEEKKGGSELNRLGQRILAVVD
jgi:hypothetical protein